MLDLQFIRDNAEAVKINAQNKAVACDVDLLLSKDAEKRVLQQQADTIRQERNQLADAAKGQRPSPEQIARGKKLKDQLTEYEEKLSALEAEVYTLHAQVPNMALPDVPIGHSEEENQVVKEWGTKPHFDFTPKNDGELGAANDLIDKERAAKVAGSRFAYLKGGIVEMQFALIQFVMRTLGDEEVIKKLVSDNNLSVSTKPFVPVLPPAVALTPVYESTGRLNGEEVTYRLNLEDDLWLNASAEHTLAPMYLNETLPESQLPIRYLGYTTAFRREAGTYGKDTEGIFRMHQFDKLEMEVFSTPETGLEEHLLLVAIQEYLMQQLEIPYQLLLKCTYDIGKPNARGVDINAWMPAQGQYRETHTADFISDYQTRRMRTRVKRTNGETVLAHTNDATAFAMGRTLKAIMENNQLADGSIRVPHVLQSYMGGKGIIS